MKDVKELKMLSTTEDKWYYIRNSFLEIVDQISPLNEICVNVSNQLPWYDEDLIIVCIASKKINDAK